MNVLITGAAGFAGSHLVTHCLSQGAKVTGIDRVEQASNKELDLTGKFNLVPLDLMNGGSELDALLDETKPHYVFHLAALASVARSWEGPRDVIEANLWTTSALLEAVNNRCPEAGVLVTCSGEEYGPVDPSDLPVSETQLLRPQNPYALSKAQCDLLCGFYADAFDMKIVRTRAFNHFGPGQGATFVAASFAKQIAKAEVDESESVLITTGNTAVRRDFTDVRDVVRSYWLVLEKAEKGVYNVCSGRSVPISELLETLSSLTDLDVKHEVNPELLRENEVMDITGSNEKLRRATNWTPEIQIKQSMQDTLDWWRKELRKG